MTKRDVPIGEQGEDRSLVGNHGAVLALEAVHQAQQFGGHDAGVGCDLTGSLVQHAPGRFGHQVGVGSQRAMHLREHARAARKVNETVPIEMRWRGRGFGRGRFHNGPPASEQISFFRW